MAGERIRVVPGIVSRRGRDADAAMSTRKATRFHKDAEARRAERAAAKTVRRQMRREGAREHDPVRGAGAADRSLSCHMPRLGRSAPHTIAHAARETTR